MAFKRLVTVRDASSSGFREGKNHLSGTSSAAAARVRTFALRQRRRTSITLTARATLGYIFHRRKRECEDKLCMRPVRSVGQHTVTLKASLQHVRGLSPFSSRAGKKSGKIG
ncbi:hypothetical protein KCP75_20380 [Salmonella enterica subsp. enterica]|nr:hypothetical protein KCP75_20380 [Salmonella enterica subsp. enterica]